MIHGKSRGEYPNAQWLPVATARLSVREVADRFSSPLYFDSDDLGKICGAEFQYGNIEFLLEAYEMPTTTGAELYLLSNQQNRHEIIERIFRVLGLAEDQWAATQLAFGD